MHCLTKIPLFTYCYTTSLCKDSSGPRLRNARMEPKYPWVFLVRDIRSLCYGFCFSIFGYIDQRF
jgi:hypothetical protein